MPEKRFGSHGPTNADDSAVLQVTGNISSLPTTFHEDAPLYFSGECVVETCGLQNYGVRIRPRTFAVRYRKDF